MILKIGEYMKVKILRGTNQIGGCITEITSKETKIIIDFGEELLDIKTQKKKANPMIEGLTTGKKDYDAVFITHNHMDHIGLICWVLPDIPIYVERTSKDIFNILNDFMNVKEEYCSVDMMEEKTVKIKDIKVTPYIVDHSAYNSLMLLIESDGKKMLHTGDFRNHGYKGNRLVDTLIKIGKVDALIIEGTSFSRVDKKFLTENELSEKATEIMKDYNQVFVLQSGTNIDRLTSMYKASQKTNKIFVEDIFAANLVSLTNSSIPNPKTFSNVYTYIPQNRYIKNDAIFYNKYIKHFDKKNAIKMMFNNDYVMNIRTSMLKDLIKLTERGLITNACLIYSMWNGYKEKEEFKQFLKKVEEFGINIIDLHTSGHADIDTIKKVIDYLKPNIVIPIHTTNKRKIKELFGNGIILDDKEEREI